jgi:hypothetical protein
MFYWGLFDDHLEIDACLDRAHWQQPGQKARIKSNTIIKRSSMRERSEFFSPHPTPEHDDANFQGVPELASRRGSEMENFSSEISISGFFVRLCLGDFN